MTYAQARKDFETLEGICELPDWLTLQDELEELMRNPTKERAKRMYREGIEQWLWQNRIYGENPIVKRIAKRHKITP